MVAVIGGILYDKSINGIKRKENCEKFEVKKMKSSMKRLMAYLLVIFLVLGAFPLLSSSTGAESRNTRDTPVLINSIGIKDANESSEGKLEPGTYNVTFEFNTTALVGLNVTIKSSAGAIENHTKLGSYIAGNHTIISSNNWTFNAASHWVNVTIWNGTESDSMNKTYTFEDVYNLAVEYEGISFSGAESGGFYANDSLDIIATITNNGNKEITADITVNFTVVNATNVTLNTSGVKLSGLAAGDEADASYLWTPPVEGDYAVNVTWNCTDVNGDTVEDLDANETFKIMNVTGYTATLEIMDDTINAGDTLNAWINVTNSGNVEHDFDYTVNVSKTGWSMEEMLSTGDVAAGATHSHPYASVIAENGGYTISVDFNHTGDDLSDSFAVLQLNHAPTLDDETTLPGIFHPFVGYIAATAYGGDTVNFIVAYEDEDDDAPTSIKLYLGKDWNVTSKMFGTEVANYTLTAENATDTDYTDGNNFTYAWTAVVGTDYEYAFIANDSEFQVEEVDSTGFDVLTPLPTDGTVSGRVSSGTGNNTTYIASAKVVIYQVDQVVEQQNISGNLTNVTVNVTTYFNATSDANGNYTKTLEFGNYTTYVNATGYVDSDETTFTVVVSDHLETVDFNLTEWEPTTPADTTGELGGFVVSATGPVIVGAKVTVVIFTETTEQQNISGNMTNVTTKTYANLTATSGANGDFLISGIAPGTLNVIVTAADFEVHSEDITFTTALTEKNFTLTATVVTYKITGKVVPITATVKQGSTAVTVNNVTGAFELGGIANNTTVTLTFSATGYVTQTKTVTLNGSADKDIGTITLELVIVPDTYTVSVGPIPGAGEGATVTFVYANKTWTGTTNANGTASITGFPLVAVPANTEITATKEGMETITWKQGDSIPEMKAEKEDDDSNLVLYIIIAIVAVLIVVIVIVLLMRKKPEEAGIDLEEEGMEEGIGEDFDDDMGAIEEDDGFEEFEPEPSDEEMEGVDDYAEELEEFEDEEDFDDEDFDDYEDEFDDDEFDDDEFNDDEFDDDEFDDDDFDDDL